MESFIKHLEDLDSTMEKIQRLTKDASNLTTGEEIKQAVEAWADAIDTKIAEGEETMPLVYAANDVIQAMKKTSPIFIKEFKQVLPDALRTVVGSDYTTMSKVERVIQIWAERRVFESDFIKALKSALNSNANEKNSSGERLGIGNLIRRSSASEQPVSVLPDIDESDISLPLRELLERVSNTESFIEKTEQTIETLISDLNSGNGNASDILSRIGEDGSLVSDSVEGLSSYELSSLIGKAGQTLTQILTLQEGINLKKRSLNTLMQSLRTRKEQMEGRLIGTNGIIRECDKLQHVVESLVDKGLCSKSSDKFEVDYRFYRRIKKKRTISEEDDELESAERKSKKQNETKAPVMFSKELGMYIPLPSTDREEDWRN